MLDEPEIEAKKLNGQKWYEIDDIQDLDIASSIFAPDDSEKVRLIQRRYGGYWRYPGMIDFCYLVNPFFPPERMKDEIIANFNALLTNYPSGMEVNSLLAGKNFGVHKENIITGNGAAELIKSLMEKILTGRAGFIRPTFEEYPNRYDAQSSAVFIPSNRDYHYDADDIINFFTDKGISSLVLINPDNPSGNYIDTFGIHRLIAWTAEHNIRLILDESFADFADEEDNSMIRQKVLDGNPHLFIVKSISKSYGVPGLRLGVLASGDTGTIQTMKKDLAIWNVNSFGEFFMQIFEKYKNDYHDALVKFKAERARLESELSKIKGIRVIHSQANFIMAELGGISSAEIVKVLLVKHGLFIKDLSSKTGGEYIRLAVRDYADNNRLLSALKGILQPEL